MSDQEIRLRITTEMDIRLAIFRAKKCAEQTGFPAHGVSMIATTVSELARNILEYGQSGEMAIRVVERGGSKGLEIVAEDCGPGIDDIPQALQDHFSSGGTLGLGLPGVKRMMDEFDIESAPQMGTRVTVTKWL